MIKFFKFLIPFFLTLGVCFVIFLKIDLSYTKTPLRAKVESNGGFYTGLKGVHIGSSFWTLSNSNGAYSRLYRGEKTMGVLFGGCTFDSVVISHEEQLSQKLSEIMGDTFIENLSNGSLYCRVLSEKLKRINKKYDYILISNQCARDSDWSYENKTRCDFKYPSSFKKYGPPPLISKSEIKTS